MNQHNLRTYTAFLETTLPWSDSVYTIENSFKLAFLRLPNLSIIDSHAIDNIAFQNLLKNESFCKVLNQNTIAGPSCEIHVRSDVDSYKTVLEYWLDIAGKREDPTVISGVSSEMNEQIRKEHANKTLTLSRFQELVPKYWEHVEGLKTKVNHTYKTDLHRSFHQSLIETLDDLEKTFPVSNYQKLTQMLNKHWKNFEGSERSDYLLSARKLVKENNLNEETQHFIEQGILSFTYQKQMASIANGKFVPGEESDKWISKNINIKTNQTYKIKAKMPNNRFISELTWEGLHEIRQNEKLIQSMMDLRTTSRSPIRTEYRDAASSYFDELTKSYKHISENNLAPDPYYWQDISIYIIDILAKGAGAFFGNLLGSSMGNIGAGIGEIAGNSLNDMCNGFVTSKDHLVDAGFKQIIGDLSSPITS